MKLDKLIEELKSDGWELDKDFLNKHESFLKALVEKSDSNKQSNLVEIMRTVIKDELTIYIDTEVEHDYYSDNNVVTVKLALNGEVISEESTYV